jgi:hypothetical protein
VRHLSKQINQVCIVLKIHFHSNTSTLITIYCLDSNKPAQMSRGSAIFGRMLSSLTTPRKNLPYAKHANNNNNNKNQQKFNHSVYCSKKIASTTLSPRLSRRRRGSQALLPSTPPPPLVTTISYIGCQANHRDWSFNIVFWLLSNAPHRAMRFVNSQLRRRLVPQHLNLRPVTFENVVVAIVDDVFSLLLL